MNQTLRNVFPDVVMYPGDQMRFFATHEGGRLLQDHRPLTDRIRQRGLALSYVREDTLQDAFSPLRRQYFSAMLKETAQNIINKDFRPFCYAYALQLWAAQWHPWMKRFISAIIRISLSQFWWGMVLAGGGMLAVFWIRRCGLTAAAAASVVVAGGITMVLQVVLLLVFQILEGALYLHLALIVAFFMAGLATGAALVSWRSHRAGSKFPFKQRFVQVQTLLCLAPLGLAGLFLIIHGPLRAVMSSTMLAALFPGLSFFAGILGGLHFSLAVHVMAGAGHPLEAVGGRLYALDLLGAAGGVFAATVFLIPAIGPIHTLPLLSAAAGVSLLTLLKHAAAQ